MHPHIVNESQFPNVNDREDLAVGSGGLTSGRDQNISESTVPHDPSKWTSASLAINSSDLPGSKITVWLPKDRKMVNKIVDIYFTRLNIHRPVFFRSDFDNHLNALYDGKNVQHDPGFMCSMYLILALGTLSELNHKASAMDDTPKAPSGSPILTKRLLSVDWPEYYDFFERALVVKPHLRVTVSSLQALILLHWYLYTEVRLTLTIQPAGDRSSLYLCSDKGVPCGASLGVSSGLLSSLACTTILPHRVTPSLTRKAS